ncbi:MAG: hypothetical protein ACI4IM_11075 [Acutalibacteraceae bacterium]
MKKIIALLLAVIILFSFTSCIHKDNAELIIGGIDRMVNLFSLSQLTSDRSLIGIRYYHDSNRCTGSYSSTCLSESGRDVIFGGGSVKEKTVRLKAKILTESGTALLRIRLGSEVKEYKVDSNGNFEKEFDFQGGGNYIMIDYDNFTGTVELISEYKK